MKSDKVIDFLKKLQSRLQNSSKLNELSEAPKSLHSLTIMRNLGYGGAAASLVILIGLTQIPNKDLSIYFSLLSIAISLSFWVLGGAIYEYLINLYESAADHISTPQFQKTRKVAHITSALGIFLAISGIMTHISWFLLLVFLTSSIIAIYIGINFHINLSIWLKDNENHQTDQSTPKQ